jgi:hypothetical protein
MYLSVCLSIHPFIHPSIYLSIYLSIFSVQEEVQQATRRIKQEIEQQQRHVKNMLQTYVRKGSQKEATGMRRRGISVGPDGGRTCSSGELEGDGRKAARETRGGGISGLAE